MKKIVIPIRLPELRNPEVDCPMGARVHNVVMALEKIESGIIVSADAAGKKAVREVMNIILECDVATDENGDVLPPVIEKRGFLIVKSMDIIEEKELIYIGSAPSMQHGILFHVFEFKPLGSQDPEVTYPDVAQH